MNIEREIKIILNEFLQKKDNLILSERIFIAVSILNWAYLNHKDKDVLKYYLAEVKKHLSGEITLYWENGVVRVKRGKK